MKTIMIAKTKKIMGEENGEETEKNKWDKETPRRLKKKKKVPRSDNLWPETVYGGHLFTNACTKQAPPPPFL